MKYSPWSEDEKNFLRTHHTQMTTKEIAEYLERPEKSVGVVLRELGFKSNNSVKRQPKLRGLSKPIEGTSKVSSRVAAGYLVQNYDYTNNILYPTVLHIRKDGRRSWSEKVFVDLYNLKIIEE